MWPDAAGGVGDLTGDDIRGLARECGFELAGVARAEPVAERTWYHEWVDAGCAGEMGYLTDRRADVRDDPRNLLASAKTVVCVGKLYNTVGQVTGLPTRVFDGPTGQVDDVPHYAGWISRYAWGEDYHQEMRRGLGRLDALVRERMGGPVESKICVDTAPLLERSYARAAGLGWVGKNTCLINQQSGSWFFLGELLMSIEIEPDAPPPDRCGTCTRCIDACPTGAILPTGGKTAGATVDSRLCISYLTIELRGAVPEQLREGMGSHVFGCDICQDVCPWNRRAPVTSDAAFQPRHYAPPLEKLARLTEQEFRSMFQGTPVTRARYSGFLRNVAIAMGNQGLERFRRPLEKLAASPDPLVAEHARWGLRQLG
ncbi:MAG TPA: tRNA epoxyqueuosine(34) reductase QueG [Bryobacteraceae bacterium]|jgi:epoxyqueuosine reductase|nr:tRNA epoxyqueuosine(34) reductase QueG [Bryobacteraceae bacterium]